MPKLTWKSWLAVWLGLGLVTGALTVLLRAQGAGSAAVWTDFIGALLANAWAVFGLIRWREVTWVKRVNTFVLTTLGFGLAVLLFLAIGWEPGWRTTAYLYLAVLGFLLGINLLRLLLKPGHPILGVARTMLEEALRMGIALIFIVALLVLLVLLPLILGSEDRVTYMVQRFLVYSTATVSVLLGMMTVLLAARTVSLELSSRQAHMTLTKPLARWQYLLGKWLGIMLLNAVLVGVSGVAIYGFTMAIARNPALNDLDRFAVDREVLTARLGMAAQPVDTTWPQMYANVLQEKQLRDPDKFGEVGDPFGQLPQAVQQEVIAETVSGFYFIEAGGSRTYQFTGLSSAVEASERSIRRGQAILRDAAGLGAAEAEQYVSYVLGRPNELKQDTIAKVTPKMYEQLVRELEREKIQLILTPDTSPEPEDQFVEFYLKINNQPFPRPPAPNAPPIPVGRGEVAVEAPYEVDIPASMISNDGSMRVTIEVPRQRRDGFNQRFVQFDYKDAEVLVFYRVGSFEANLAKAMVIVWIKLCFLAMLGLAAGSMLSFPIAAMVGIVVFVTASASGVIDQSLSSFASTGKGAGAWEVITQTVSMFFSRLGEGEVYGALRILIRLIGESFMLMIPSFGAYGTGDLLAGGRVIAGDMLLGAVLKIGLMWTGLVGAIGLYFFSKKEIARVTV